MNAFCNEFPQAPTLQSFKRDEGSAFREGGLRVEVRVSLAEEFLRSRNVVPDMTMTTDTSFVERPAAARGAPAGGQRVKTQRGRGGTTTSRGRGYGR
jgi:hypothetical protein